MTTFAELGVSDAVVAALGERGIVDAFPIQTATIEAALAGKDICGKAPTGSGKTLAFGIPAIDLATKGMPWHPSVLILAPTRELATQIKDELEPLAKERDRSILTVFGGTNIQRDMKQLEKGVDILVACPGRLEDLISRRCCELRNVEIVIVDEADRMADMGFLPSVKRILDQTPGNRHTLLFSATLDGDVDMLIKRYQQDPLTFEVEEEIGEVGDVEHSWFLVQPVNRIGQAVTILQRYSSSIVFCRTRRGCDRVAKTFVSKGLSAVAIHGDRSQFQRERALKDFTSGKAQVLVATDVAARGIHVDNVALVMHYDPAGSDKDYIHRSGRTGRAGQDGRVISMVVEDKSKIAKQLQKDLKVKRGFDDYNVEDLPDFVVRPKFKPEPKEHESQDERERRGDPNHGERKRGGMRPEGRNRGSGNRKGGRSGGRDRQGGSEKRSRGYRDRDDRDGFDGRNSDDRNRADRDDRHNDDRPKGRSGKSSGGYRGRNDDGRSGKSSGGYRGRNDDGRSGKPGRDNDRGERRPDGKRKAPRRRPGSNDWFPPGYHDDEKRGRGDKRSSSGKGRGAGGRSDRDGEDRDDRGGSRGSRSTSSKRADERDDRTTGGPGGRGTAKKKNRTTKGRHADKGAGKNKGKRQGPHK